MDQIEGGTLIVNKGNEATIKEGSVQDDERDLNLVEGLAEGWKLAEVRTLVLTLQNPTRHLTFRPHCTGQPRPTDQDDLQASRGDRPFRILPHRPRDDLSRLHANPTRPRSSPFPLPTNRRPFLHFGSLLPHAPT